MFRKLLILLTILPCVAFAQSYPNYSSTYVNDLGNLIEDQTEAEIIAALTTLREDTGVEATVLTLDSWKAYGGHNTIESFATGLFNHWGIGDAEKNDGILILVAEEERAMRIELGSGYPRSYDIYAGDVIDGSFLPSFRNENYNDGIRIGTMAVIENIARRHAGGLEPPERPNNEGSGGVLGWVIGVLAVLGAGIVWVVRKFSIGNKPCPSCGQKHLSRTRETLEKATTKSAGRGEQTITCGNCDYRDVSTYTISRISRSSSSSGGSFGGGSSSGGGASGKW